MRASRLSFSKASRSERSLKSMQPSHSSRTWAPVSRLHEKPFCLLALTFGKKGTIEGTMTPRTTISVHLSRKSETSA